MMAAGGFRPGMMQMFPGPSGMRATRQASGARGGANQGKTGQMSIVI